jgi:glycosyltransferase involved in cell wall biosynthesis
MSSKRILILTNRVPYPLNDGGNLATKAMVEGYHNAGWQVYLLSMNTSRHFLEANVLTDIYTNISRFDAVFVNNDVKPLSILTNFLFSKEPNHGARFKNKAFSDAVKEAIVLFKPDVIHVESVFLTGYLPLIKKLTNATTILRLHNIESQIWQRLANESKGIKQVYLSDLAKRIGNYEPQAWAQYDLLLPITDNDAFVVKQALPQAKMKVVPFGVDTDKIQPQTGSEWVGYHIGAMDWLPNAEGINWFLKEAWPQIHQQDPEFTFHFAGRKMPESFLKTNIAGVKCHGEVPDANAFIADKKILIVPLRSGGGIRVKILEAMAMGKIVISTTIGMQGIDAIPGTHFLEANTPQQFSEAINWALSNRKAAELIGTNAAALIHEKYDANAIQKALIMWLETHR